MCSASWEAASVSVGAEGRFQRRERRERKGFGYRVRRGRRRAIAFSIWTRFQRSGRRGLVSITAALLMLVELNSRNGWQATLLTQ